MDGQAVKEYEERLEENLQSLLDRFKSGTYQALFLSCSHGCRPGRSAHTALCELRQELMEMGGGWVLEVDIKAFFDSLSHSQLRTILDQRVRDGVLRRTIDKWLAAGVMEGCNSAIQTPEPRKAESSHQCSRTSISTMHWTGGSNGTPNHVCAVVRAWFVSPTILSWCSPMKRTLVLPKRVGRYGLTLHPTKTRLLYFRPPSAGDDQTRFTGKQSFDFLGFTHHWARSRRGLWVVMRKTASGRFGRALKRASEWLRSVRTSLWLSSMNNSYGSYAGTTIHPANPPFSGFAVLLSCCRSWWS